MSHTEEEKHEVIDEYRQGVPIDTLSAKHNICTRTVYRWAKECPGTDNSIAPSTKEYKSLQRKVEKLEKIVSILKTANCTVKAPLREKLAELEKLYGQYDVHTLCEALDVSRGTFYNHIFRSKRNDAWFMKRREEYRKIIQDTFDEYNQILGPEKLRVVLVQQGHQVSTKFVTSMMAEMGLYSIRSTSKQDYKRLHESTEKENVLKRQFHAETPNQVWTSDVTCYKLGDHYYYICVILDLFSRKVIAYKISRKNSTQLITSTFRAALTKREIGPGLLFHSDRGTPYTSHSFCNLLASLSVVQSFSSPAQPHDNAVTETFFSTLKREELKREELYRKDYPSEKKFKQAVDTYMTFYNTKRPHRTLKNLTPCQAEEQFYANQE